MGPGRKPEDQFSHNEAHMFIGNRECGLMVQSIEPGGRISKDGRLRVEDRIVEINEHNLHEISFQT